MGKGKKRDKDKKEIDQLARDTAPLSISDAQPSTSQASGSQSVDVEAVGLGLGLSSRNQKKKQKALAKVASDVEMSQPKTELPTPMDIPMEESPAFIPLFRQETQEESVGLGIGRVSKSRPRKKKSAAQSNQPPLATASAPVSVSEPAPSPSGSAPSLYLPIPGQKSSLFPASSGSPAQTPGSRDSDTRTPVSGAPSCSFSSLSETPQSLHSPLGSDRSDLSEFKSSSSFLAGSSTERGRGRGRAKLYAPQRSEREASSGRGAARREVELSKPGREGTKSATEQSRPLLSSIPPRITGHTIPGTRRVKVLTNYLPMKIKPLKVYRYDVGVYPDKPKKFLLQCYNLAKEKLFPRHTIAFDQTKTCYCLTALPGVTSNERVSIPVEFFDTNEKSLRFDVSFKMTGVVDFETIIRYMREGTTLCPPTEAIHCIDIILKQGTLESYIRSGRQYFMRPHNPKDLGDGLEMWSGLFQSAIFTSQPFINIDVAHKGFPKNQTLIEAMSHDFKLDLNRPIEYQKGRAAECFLDFIKGLKVVAKLLGGQAGRSREFICNCLVNTPDKQEFTFTDNESNQQITMTVGDYFRKKKGYRIIYPNINCMWVGPKEKGIYFPLELLEVAYGQCRSKQLNEKQLSIMVREAATPPDIRKKKIEEVIQKMNYSANPYFKHFGLEIKHEFFGVDSKVIDPPSLQVGAPRSVMPRDGSWQAKTLLRPKTLDSWGFIAVDLNPHESNSRFVIDSLMDMARQMGMAVSSPQMQQFNVRVDALRRTLLTAVDNGVRFMFIVISKRGRDIYQKVKKIAEREVGILTQCIKEATVTNRMNPQTARNILLKVNSKLMGVNQALDQCSVPPCLRSGDVMVVGADVTHPSPDQKNIPSIAAVTASLDPKCFIYNIELSVQTPKEEMIVDFEDMIFDHFVLYRKHQGKLPRKVFVYRDGVSEGQFSQVMQFELTAMHRAFDRLSGDKKLRPEVLFLLVQKRHHTRFFLSGNQARYNVLPGTVVDTHIVHPRELDFYLVSHQAIKGTARPTRYHAVCNDGKIPDDEVEQLTYYLCHLYSRCMRSVSYPTPTYYAHLACLRARSLTYGESFVVGELERKPMRLRVLDKMLQHSRMFFV